MSEQVVADYLITKYYLEKSIHANTDLYTPHIETKTD
jgi:hypothetical protein